MTTPATCEIAFRNREANLRFLQQSGTYDGLLEGLPTVEMNRGIIESHVGGQWSKHYDVPPYLVPPRETPIETFDDRPYPFGTPASLPSLICVARFESYQPTTGRDGDGSGLVVIWFQQNFALPIDDEVLRHLAEVDWNQYAGSFWD